MKRVLLLVVGLGCGACGGPADVAFGRDGYGGASGASAGRPSSAGAADGGESWVGVAAGSGGVARRGDGGSAGGLSVAGGAGAVSAAGAPEGGSAENASAGGPSGGGASNGGSAGHGGTAGAAVAAAGTSGTSGAGSGGASGSGAGSAGAQSAPTGSLLLTWTVGGLSYYDAALNPANPAVCSVVDQFDNTVTGTAVAGLAYGIVSPLDRGGSSLCTNVNLLVPQVPAGQQLLFRVSLRRAVKQEPLGTQWDDTQSPSVEFTATVAVDKTTRIAVDFPATGTVGATAVVSLPN